MKLGREQKNVVKFRIFSPVSVFDQNSMKVSSYERMVSVEETIEKNHTTDGRGLGDYDFSQKLLVHGFIGFFLSVSKSVIQIYRLVFL